MLHLLIIAALSFGNMPLQEQVPDKGERSAKQGPDLSIPPPGYELNGPARLEAESLVDQAGKALLDGLNDPASARYRTVFVRTTIGQDSLPHHQICGEVNARNSMGGYTGWQVFAFSAGSLYVGRGTVLDAALICQRSRGHWDSTDYAGRLADAARLED